MTNWTRKHNNSAYRTDSPPPPENCGSGYSTRYPSGNNEIIDLRDFNKWVKRTRGFPHDPKTVKSAAQQLRDKGVLTNAKRYTAYVWKWTLQPICVLIPPVSPQGDKKSVSQLQIPGLDPSTPQSVEDGI
jgi:hypothetical protein